MGRMRKIKAEVLRRTDTTDEQYGSRDIEYSHERFQRFDFAETRGSLNHLVFKREERVGDAVAVTRHKPALQNNWLVVTLDDNQERDRVYEIESVLPKGRWQYLILDFKGHANSFFEEEEE